jgi:predicted RNase H-like nuclease (RuvC/YqgF family)
MSATMLDTYSMIKKLQAAGVPEKQAEAQVAMVFEVAEKTFATKADTNKIGEGLTVLGTNVTKLDEKVTRLDATVTKLGADVTKLQKDCATKDDLKAYATKNDLEALENRLIIKLGGVITGLMIVGFAFLSYAH